MVFLFPLPKDNMTPRQEKIAYATSPLLMLIRNAGSVCSPISCFPIKREKIREMVVRLTAMPKVRMAPIMPEAIPNCRFSTLPMIAVELGVMKIPKPKPISINSMITTHRGTPEAVVIAAKRSPAELASIPQEAIFVISNLSANRPAIGDAITCISGCMSSTNPASLGEKPLAYWRKRLIRKMIPKVAA